VVDHKVTWDVTLPDDPRGAMGARHSPFAIDYYSKLAVSVLWLCAD
jgi:hypothetical protein